MTLLTPSMGMSAKMRSLGRVNPFSFCVFFSFPVAAISELEMVCCSSFYCSSRSTTIMRLRYGLFLRCISFFCEDVEVRAEIFLSIGTLLSGELIGFNFGFLGISP